MITTSRVIQMEDATGFPVAVKRWSKAEENENKAKWEHKVLQLMQGPGVPRLIRAFEDAEYMYVVTEWISGVTLDQFVEESGGFLSWEVATRIGDRLCAILRRLHNSFSGSFVYTDLKPSNVMVKGQDVFLVDFESVCPAGRIPVKCDEKTVVMGSRPFTAPEVFTGKIYPECDYYSLGMLMFYMLTGELWQGDSGLLSDDAAGNRILKLMDPDPAKRKSGLKIFPSEKNKNTEAEKSVNKADRVSDSIKPLAEQNSSVFFINDNPRFAVELVYEAAMHMNLKVGLFPVVEKDILPAAKSLGIRRVRLPGCSLDNREQEKSFMKNSGTEQWLERGYLMQPEGFGKLYISLVPPARIMNHLKFDEWNLFCYWAKRNFDITIIMGSLERDYIALCSDTVILAPRPDTWETENARLLGETFKENKEGLKLRYVAWEYKEGVSMSLDRFAEKTEEEHYIGEIYHDSNRQMTENMEQLPYCFSMPEIIRQQYQNIIKNLMQK